MLTDTHTHIHGEEFDTDWQEMFDRAQMAGVGRMILPSTDRERYERMQLLSQTYPDQIYPTIGLHPGYVKQNYKEELSFVREHLYDSGLVAVGEIGLDYHWDTSFRTEQIEAFELQMDWAKEANLPIIIHTRSAFSDTFECLRRKDDERLRGVFHSFTGSQEELQEALGFSNFYIALNGVVTFKNSNLRDYLTQIPLDRLLLETDAPYLAPVPNRGKRNEPSYMIHTAGFVANLYKISLEELGAITSENATRLFNL